MDDSQVEVAIYKREFTAEQRKRLAKEGKALPNESYPIETAADLHPAALLVRSGHGDVDAAKALIARRAKELKAPNPLDDDKAENLTKADINHDVKLWKGEREGKFYGVVLEPDLPDSQDDEVGPEEIEKACHEFMRAYQNDRQAHDADVQHAGRSAGADLIENFIAPQDMTIEGEPVRKGAWVTGWQVNDPVVKSEIENGELTGLSIEGSAFRQPVAA